MGLCILPLAQAQSLEIILDSSFSHTPHPISQQILLTSPSGQIHNLLLAIFFATHLWSVPLSPSI